MHTIAPLWVGLALLCCCGASALYHSFSPERQTPPCAKSFCCVRRRTHGILWLGLGFLVLQWGVFLHFTCAILSLGM